MNIFIEKQRDERFQSWLKVHIGLNHTRDGLIDFVTAMVETFHRESLSAVNNEICRQCQTGNIVSRYTGRIASECVARPCPNGVCDRLRDTIISRHYYHNPSWKNTHAERWCVTPWEMAKCFMPLNGYKYIRTIAETDINGILNVMINLTMFDATDLRTKAQEVRDIGNNVRHYRDLSVEEADASRYLDKMIQLLTSDEILRYNTTAVEKLKMLQTNTISTSTEGVMKVLQDMDYESRKSDLKQDLITFYKMENSSVPVSPLVPSNEAPILNVYVKQRMENVEWRWTPESRKILTSYRDLFTEGSRNIYIAAEAGAGKTTLMKWFCATWCGSQDQYEEEEDNSGSDVLKRFDFLFLILLTDVREECDVDGMIERQIIKSLSRSGQYDNNFMERLLHQEKCLVLLDGLDEWSHPIKPQCRKHLSIPHRKCRENWTILTTSRPWKIHSAQLSFLKIDKYIELVDHDMQNIRQLAEKVTGQLETVHRRGRQYRDFFRETEQNGINLLQCSPLMLVQMICLWHDDIPLEKTKCKIYSNIIEFILHHGIARLHNPTSDNQIELTMDPPACIIDLEYFMRYFRYMIDLGEFALNLICDGREANVHQEKYQFLLDVGLLTERMSYKMSEHVHRFGFIHKTFQEYFCALFLSMLPDDQCLAKIAETCKSVESILAVSDMLVFLTGMRPRLMNCVTSQLRSVIANDSLANDYRRTIGNSIDWEKQYKQLKQLQEVYISCVRESTNGTQDIEIHLEDVFIDNDCEAQSIRDDLNTVIEENARSLKSIKIYGCNNSGRISFYLEHFNLYQVQTLEKLEVVGHLEEDKILRLLGNSARTLKCLTLCKVPRRYGQLTTTNMLTPIESLNVIKIMPNLESLMLESFTLPHSQLEDLAQFISQRPTMKQVALGLLQCSDHKMECIGVDIHLSEHCCLQLLELGDILLSDVKVNTTALKRCRIGKLGSDPSSSLYLLSKMLNCLRNAKKLTELMLFDFESHEEVNNILKNIPSLDKLQVIVLKRIDLGEKRMNFPKGVNHIKLCEVQMSSAEFRNIVDRNENVPVKFELLQCRITPENEYQEIKNELRNSSHYEIWCDEYSQESGEQFVFMTVPNREN